MLLWALSQPSFKVVLSDSSKLLVMSILRPIRERTKPGKLYKFRGLLWQPVHSVTHTTGNVSDYVEGMPYCPKCKAKLTQKSDYDLYCDLCDAPYKAEPSIDHVALLTSKAYNAKLKEGWVVETLDLPPGVVKDQDENDEFWVEARLGQKDGKLMAVIYFGDKKRGGDGKKAYSQVFLDLEDEQMRFDKANKNPLEIISRLKTEFLSSTHTSEKKETE